MYRDAREMEKQKSFGICSVPQIKGHPRNQSGSKILELPEVVVH
jgi:hypothetical protein